VDPVVVGQALGGTGRGLGHPVHTLLVVGLAGAAVGGVEQAKVVRAVAAGVGHHVAVAAPAVHGPVVVAVLVHGPGTVVQQTVLAQLFRKGAVGALVETVAGVRVRVSLEAELFRAVGDGRGQRFGGAWGQLGPLSQP